MRDVASSERPSLADLKALAPALPPSDRIGGAESADVLSALVAVVTHGREILEAAKQGSNGVYQFMHDSAVAHAEEHGHPAPEKGQQLAQPEALPAAPVAPGQQQAIDYDQLAAAIVRAQQANDDATANAKPVAPADPPASEVQAHENVTDPAPVHQGEQGKEPTAADVAASQSQEITSEDGIL